MCYVAGWDVAYNNVCLYRAYIIIYATRHSFIDILFKMIDVFQETEIYDSLLLFFNIFLFS